MLTIWKKNSKLEDTQKGIDEKDEVYNFKNIKIYDFDILVKQIIVDLEESFIPLLVVNFHHLLL